jgi:phage shock protein E
MKVTYIIIGIILVVTAAVVIVNANKSPAQTNKVGFTTVQADISSGAVLYDVRTESEYDAGHFANAKNRSLQDMQAGKLPSSSKDTKTYVYCQSGNRSAQAAKLLQEAGYTDVIDLGGLNDVQASGGTLGTGAN